MHGSVLRAVGIALGASLLAAVAAALLAPWTLSPLLALSRRAAAVAAGKVEGRPAAGEPDPELRSIAAAVEQLVQSLQQEQAAAAEQRATSGALLAALTDGVVVLDRHGAAHLLNPAARSLLDVPVDAAAATPFYAIVGDHDLAALAEHALRGEAGEVTLERHSGRLLRVAATPIGSRDGSVVLILRDLTDARRVERVRHEFVANASHELLTPIGTVSALVDALAAGALDDRKTARRFLKKLRTETDRLTILARDLLDLAQAESGELRLALGETDVCPIVAAVVERLQPRAAKAGVSVTNESPGDLPLVLADPDRLEQVLLSLVHNAIKFTPEGGRAVLTARATSAEVIIQVADTGVGIAAADQPRVFERFYKARSASSGSKRPGSGLGLAIARHLVEAMHGRIWLESDPGRGATFSVALQRVVAED